MEVEWIPSGSTWWNGFNKCGNGVEDVDKGIVKIVEIMGTKNQVYPAHGASIVSSIIVVDGRSYP